MQADDLKLGGAVAQLNVTGNVHWPQRHPPLRLGRFEARLAFDRILAHPRVYEEDEVIIVQLTICTIGAIMSA